MSNRRHSSRIAVPVGSCLTLTLVLVASLAPQPAGAAAFAAAERSPQNAVLRSSGGAEYALGCVLLLESGSYAALPLLLRLERCEPDRAAAAEPSCAAANPRCRARRPRAP